MTRIKSSVEAATEAVNPVLNLEKPKLKKISLGQSNISAMKNAVLLSEIMDEMLSDLIDTTKQQAKKIVKLAEKKENDDKKDSASFTSFDGSGGGRSFAKKSKSSTSKKTDWQKFGREHLEDAGVYFKPDGSGYVVDPVQVQENIIENGIGGAFDMYKEGKDQKKKVDEAYGHLFDKQNENNSVLPNKPDFNPNPNE